MYFEVLLSLFNVFSCAPDDLCLFTVLEMHIVVTDLLKHYYIPKIERIQVFAGVQFMKNPPMLFYDFLLPTMTHSLIISYHGP